MQEVKIIQQSKSFKNLDRTLTKLAKMKKGKLAGDVFEYLTKLYLEVSPEYKTKIKKVYLLKEIPTALKRKLKLPNTDEGIDLVAETFDNQYWAIQCKYRSNKTETLKVKGDLATFNNLAFTVCKNISHGIVCSTVNRPPKKTKLLSIGYILLSEWLKLDRDDGELFKQIKAKSVGKIVKPKKLVPRPHQKQAINKSISYFKTKDRGKMIMPCGTGKSLTAFWISEKLKARSILIAVPSLALLQQTLKVWTREFLLNNIKPDWLCVCSDDTVKDEQDDFVTFSADLGIKVDTDPRVIKNFLRKKSNKLKIVFTTYQSGKATAIGSKGFTYDFGIMDEAHKTVGSNKKPMAHLLHQKNIKIKKRLFMTATERLFRGDGDEYMSMDDPRDYGNLIYELSFKEAINSKPAIISDYKIITFGITIPEIEQITQDNKYLEVRRELRDITARELATAIALRKAIKKLNIKNAVSFHRSIRRAENFRKQQELISKVYPYYGNLKTFHVRGNMPTSDRALEMLSFEEEKGLMTNARCLTEGVDLPAIDCVCFTDPKRSKVDIVQAAGRALRLSKGKKFGYILIPIIVSEGADFDEAADEQGFSDVTTTVRALSTTDKRIVEYLKAVTEGRKPKGGSPVDGITSINKLHKVEAEEFNRAVQLKVWEKVAKVNHDTYENAKKRVAAAGIRSSSQYRKWKDRPLDIPYKPYNTYKFSGWISWAKYFDKRRDKNNTDWMDFDDAKKFIQKYKLKGLEDFRRWWRENKDIAPINFPANPAYTYTSDIWTSWGDFLGNKNIATHELYKDLSYEEAKKYLKQFKLKSVSHYIKLHKKGIIKDLPRDVRQKYKKDKNFLGTPDLLSIPQNIKKNFIKQSKRYSKTQAWRFEDIKKYIIEKKLNNFDELKKQVDEDKLWLNIPLSTSSYSMMFPNKWKGAKDLFGKPRFSKRIKYPSYEIVKKILSKHKFANVGLYHKNRKRLSTKDKPLPSLPQKVYADEWKSWGEFLSNDNVRTDLTIGRRRRNGRNWK